MTPVMLFLTAFGFRFCDAPSTCDLLALLRRGHADGYLWALTSMPVVDMPGYRCEKVGMADTGMTVWFCRRPLTS